MRIVMIAIVIPIVVGFIFSIAWALAYSLILKQRSILKAIALVSIVLGVSLAMYRLLYAYPGPEWILGFALGAPAGIKLVQKIGPEKPTDEGAIAVLLAGPLILILLLTAIAIL